MDKNCLFPPNKKFLQHMKTLFVVVIILMMTLVSCQQIAQSNVFTSIRKANQNIATCRYLVPSLPRSLATCTWYNSNSCCTVDTSQKIKAGWENQSGRSSGTSNVTIPHFLVEAFAGSCLDELHKYSR